MGVPAIPGRPVASRRGSDCSVWPTRAVGGYESGAAVGMARTEAQPLTKKRRLGGTGRRIGAGGGTGLRRRGGKAPQRTTNREKKTPPGECEAANCCGLSGRKNNRYVRC